MRLLTGLVLVAVLAAGCGVGKEAVDPAPKGVERFVAGSGAVVEYTRADRLPAPRIRGDAVTGPAVDTDRFDGKVLVVNWWGSWCAPCRTEAAALEEVHQVTRDKGVQFVGVNVRDVRDKAAAFERTYGMTYPSVFDEAGRVALGFRKTPPASTPATILVDRQGRVAVVFRGPVLYRQLQDAVDELLAESP
jgi:thiol-disulfide isomerase/thioredoxin